MRPIISTAIVCCLLNTLAIAADEPAPAEIKSAVEKSLPLLVAGAKGVLGHERKCFMCHNQAMPVFALVAAKSRGFAIDEEHLQAQLKHTVKFLATNQARYREGKGQGGAIDMAGYALWTLQAGGWPADDTTAAVAEYFLRYQSDKEHWTSVSNRPPSEASAFTATYLSLYSLQAYGTDEQKERITARFAKVREWLLKGEAKDTEDRVFQLRSLPIVDAKQEAIAEAKEQLLKSQRDDGGWSQLPDLESDAYATGSVLVALQESAGLSTMDKAYQRGLQFLLKSQLADGSWHVKSRSKPFQPYFESGYPHEKDQFISIAAAGWATNALLLSLPETPTNEQPKPANLESKPQ
ncbi:prenyltransferase/squalene oxidase repeat-containing protein [Anatilimnocola floriformis]|uniref:prenyltransferase/squalene oxidase repeat-containing protein n=1 Tax=Anatilimnocola floriformis TaxID=2948575 RepID=UPI0020C4326C|nr:prenyltransferase/squalene oxidase repeat-containing protein [Anatilimnocola floriformis]